MCIQVCLAKIGGQPISLLLHTHTHTLRQSEREGQTERERESLVTLLLRDLPLPRGAEGTDLLPTLLNERKQEEKSE